MSIPESDVEYGLDTEHIRAACQAWHPASTVNVTSTGNPFRVSVETRHPQLVVEFLRRVGYLAEVPAGTDQLVVTGWSTPRLTARGAALNGILDRWRESLTHTAARAVDAYALDGHESSFSDIARGSAVRRATDLLRYETEMITGPCVPHDPRIRPHDDGQARLIDHNRHRDEAIADRIARAERFADYAVQAYIEDPNTHNEPADARARAIACAIRRNAADIHREHAQRRTADDAPPSPARRDHPAAVAATDQPADQPTDPISPPVPCEAVPEPSAPPQNPDPSPFSPRPHTP